MPSSVRAVLAVVAGAAVALFGGLVLGEYEFTGAVPFLAGPLFGLVVGEVVLTAGGPVRTLAMAFATALVAFGGIVLAGWIDSSQGIEPVKRLVWVAAWLAGVVALLRVAGLRGTPRTPRSRPAARDTTEVSGSSIEASRPGR